MLDVNQRALGNQSSIAQWAYTVIGLKGVRVRTRLRGNDLHILLESNQCPPGSLIVPRFLQAIKGLNGTLVHKHPDRPIYQVIIYGRSLDQQSPDWIEPIHLNQLDRHLQKWQLASKVSTKDTASLHPAANAAPKKGSALIVSNESLARSGSTEAIARYLSETLSPLGVGVKVFIQEKAGEIGSQENQEQRENGTGDIHPHITSSPTTLRRLWVICDSDYSPDTSLLAEPIAQQLRDLSLQGFNEAVIKSQVSGEIKPEWMLRVDLTPTEEMLKDWARWGDLSSIAYLLNQSLERSQMQVRAVLKDATLHLFTSQIVGFSPAKTAPAKEEAMSAIGPLLESIAPQGIKAATVYGVKTQSRSSLAYKESPDWIEWLSLPAQTFPALAETPLELAKQGDKPALLFLLERLINTDLEQRLATGGIRLSIKKKQDLLHIISESLVCPQQNQVAPPITKFLRQLGSPQIAGVRIYGRRSGQSSPAWTYAIDFGTRQPTPLPTKPVSAPTETQHQDTIKTETYSPQPADLTTDLTADLAEEDLDLEADSFVDVLYTTAQQFLCATQLFIHTAPDTTPTPVTPSRSRVYLSSQGMMTAGVWGILGLLLMLIFNGLLAEILRLNPETAPVSAVPSLTESPKTINIPQISLQKSKGEKAPIFNGSGFTKEGDTSVIVKNQQNANEPLTTSKVTVVPSAILAGRSLNPSFNNQLLNEKLALYQQRILQNGGVAPDVLIVGSSRAMRGIDPAALQSALSSRGFGTIQVFNFGINGATVQVVDLIIRRVLTLEQQPKLIIWADGARAFNSGRTDITYKAIASSPGFKQLNEGTFPIQKAPDDSSNPEVANQTNNQKNPEQFNSKNLDDWLNQSLGKISSTYSQRDRLKAIVVNWITQLTPKDQAIVQADSSANSLEYKLPQEAIDFDGFLPISIRFNPVTYYKQHPKVAGDYDSDYYAFQMPGQQEEALDSLVQFVQSRQISLVFVNMPLTKNYLDPVRTKYEQQFQKYMREVNVPKGLIFLDLTNLWPTKNEYFSDPSHLNRNGAAQVANQIAQEPVIPWPQKQISEEVK